MLNWQENKGNPHMINTRQVWESEEGFQRLKTAIDLGSFAIPISSEVLAWIVTENIGDKAGALYEAGTLETHNSKWSQGYLRLRLDAWWGQGNIWSPSFTVYKYQFHRGQGLNVRGKNAKCFRKKEKIYIF